MIGGDTELKTWREELSENGSLNLIGYLSGKEYGSVYSSRLWGGALRDDTKNGCVGDYRDPGSKSEKCKLDNPVSSFVPPLNPHGEFDLLVPLPDCRTPRLSH